MLWSTFMTLRVGLHPLVSGQPVLYLFLCPPSSGSVGMEIVEAALFQALWERAAAELVCSQTER